MKLRHICEVCGKEEILTPEEAYETGWDYPPNIGTFGVLSPRTCPNCPINETLWFKISSGEINLEKLTDKQKEFLDRIKNNALLVTYVIIFF